MIPLKDILGKPGEGIHFHVFGIAVMDVLATVVVGCLFGWGGFERWGNGERYTLFAWMCLSCLLLFALGETLHLVIGVETAFIKWLDTRL
jgi:hypothetical protein